MIVTQFVAQFVFDIVPLVSDAVVVNVTLDPAVYMLPLVGLVILTTGKDGVPDVTVSVMVLDVVETP